MIKVRVVTYNVFGFRMLQNYRVEDYAEALRQLNPDILALQEVDEGRLFRYKEPPAKSLAKCLNMNMHYHPVYQPPGTQNSFGNSTLSRFPMEMRKKDLLPGKTWKTVIEPRGVLWSEINLKQSKVQFLNTHLSFLYFQQKKQINALVEDWIQTAEQHGAPVVLGGDFNLGGGSRLLRLLPEDIENSASQKLPTWPSQRPWRDIDHIFSNGYFSLERCFVAEDTLFKKLSDHLPLVADLILHA